MKSVLLSIQPKWCELIASGEKTVEIRKTKPKIQTPFKCYIYCSKGKRHLLDIMKDGDENFGEIYHGKPVFITTPESCYAIGNGYEQKVIGEFICDFIAEFEGELWDNETYENIREKYKPSDFDEYGEYEYTIIAENGEKNWLNKKSCLTWEELRKYIGKGINDFYGWHISNLVIYDKPKELNEFKKPTEYRFMNYRKRKSYLNGFTKPPQSWCYVEE